MATVCPHAQYDLLGPQTADRMSAHDIVCLHTMAGSFAGTDAMFHQNGFKGTESHFGVAGSGRAKQWQDLDYRADANYEGNGRVISIETADVGESFPDWLPDGPVPPWTPAQLDRIVLIVGWCCDRYDIPKRLVADSRSGRRGIAYHRQGIDGNFTGPYKGRRGVGERWSVSGGKVCPGDARIRQLIEIVIPRVRGEQEDPMAGLTDDQQLELLRNSRIIVERLTDEGTIGRRSKETTIAVRKLLAREPADVSESELAAALLPGVVESLNLALQPAQLAEVIVATVPQAVRAELAAALSADPQG